MQVYFAAIPVWGAHGLGCVVNRPLLLAAIGGGVIVFAIAMNILLWKEESGETPLVRQTATQKAARQAVKEAAQAAAKASDKAKLDAALAKTTKQQATSAPPAVKRPAPVAPTIDVSRVNPKGDTVIAGRAEPGAIVAILDNGKEIGTVLSDERGEWVFIPNKPLAPGSRRITLEMRVGKSSPVTSKDALVLVVPERDKDIAGRKTTRPSQALALKVPESGSGASTVLQKPVVKEKKEAFPISVETVDYDSSGKLFISGHAADNGTLQIYLNNRLIGHAVASVNGGWLMSPETIVDPGIYTLRADQVDKAGKVLARIEIPFSRAQPPKEDPAAPDTIAPDTITIVVQPGNSLWRIARGTYGEGTQYTVIYEANKERIMDPDLIYPGQIFTLPATN